MAQAKRGAKRAAKRAKKAVKRAAKKAVKKVVRKSVEKKTAKKAAKKVAKKAVRKVARTAAQWPPEGFEVCGPGCKAPAKRDGEVWCQNTPTCQNRGAGCNCNLFKRKRGQRQWEHAAGPNSKVREEEGYEYRCSCVKKV